MNLCITEKPSVAKSVADAILGRSNYERKDGYFEGENLIVSWCVGHLIELAQPAAYGSQYEKWNYNSLPVMPERFQHVVKEDTEEQFRVLENLMKRNDVTELTCATDAGREGELIFRLVYDMAGCTKPFKRLWVSSMEDKAIRDGFANMKDGHEYDNLYRSALCRQEADWLVGINGTRLFTTLYGGKVLKVGRVQTPTLSMLVDREMEITNFKPQKYFLTHLISDRLDAVSEKTGTKEEADHIVQDCSGSQATVASLVKEKKTASPPKLYDLTTLQRDANRILGFTAKQTLEYTQSLYEDKLTTYPRTDSQFLSDDMETTAGNVIGAICSVIPFAHDIRTQPDIRRVMNSKKVTDHHAIIPTVEILNADLSALPDGERKVLFLIADRLLCATGESQEYESVKAEILCNGHAFQASGRTVLKNGFKDYEQKMKDFFGVKVSNENGETEEEESVFLPDLQEGMILTDFTVRVTDHMTKAQPHFTEASLLSAMERAGSADIVREVERKGLGTPATRADIIEKLVHDGFVKREKKQMVPTADGMKLITILPDVIKSPKLTADWENTLSQIAVGEVSAGEFMQGIKEMVNGLIRNYHEVGEEEKKMFAGDYGPSYQCPHCGGEVVKGKFGLYCKGRCGMTFGYAMGKALSENQVVSLLEGKKILMKGLKSNKSGIEKTYDCYLIPDGVQPYRFNGKDGAEHSGYQYKFKIEFPKKKKKAD